MAVLDLLRLLVSKCVLCNRLYVVKNLAVYWTMLLINFKTCVSLTFAAHVCHGDLLGGTNTVSDEYWDSSYK